MPHSTSGPTDNKARVPADPKPYHTTHVTASAYRPKFHPVLDILSDPDPRVDRALQVALDQIYALALPLRTTSYGPKVKSGGGPRSFIPPDDQVQLLRGDYDRAETHRARFAVLIEARSIVDGFTRAHGPSVIDHNGWKVRLANDPRPLRVLEQETGIGRGTLSKWRKKYRRPDSPGFPKLR